MSRTEIPEAISDPAGEQFSLDSVTVRALVRDLHRADQRIYWADLIGTCVVGWSSFACAVMLKPFTAAMVVAVALSVCTLYRALCLMHEITHQSARALPHFEAAWNWMVGFPLLMPSFVYVGVHQSHHRVNVYGTEQDPEYMPFAHSRKLTTIFALESFFIPLLLVLRFIILTPVGFFSARLQKLLIVYGSSLTMNLKYRREFTSELRARVRRDSLSLWVMWAAVIVAAAAGLVPWRIFLVWLAVDSLISFINTMRTLGAHAYENEGEPMDRVGQLLDSIDTPGAFYTELWAPVGLRYHALHHYFPGIPYHNLAEAYRRIMSHVVLSADYSRMTSPSLQYSLRQLLRKGGSK